MREPKSFGRRCVRRLLESACAVALAAGLGLLQAPAAAQVLYGSMTGTITDTSGASVPGGLPNPENDHNGANRPEVGLIVHHNGTHWVEPFGCGNRYPGSSVLRSVPTQALQSVGGVKRATGAITGGVEHAASATRHAMPKLAKLAFIGDPYTSSGFSAATEHRLPSTHAQQRHALRFDQTYRH